jgi:hypothetical protein
MRAQVRIPVEVFRMDPPQILLVLHPERPADFATTEKRWVPDPASDGQPIGPIMRHHGSLYRQVWPPRICPQLTFELLHWKSSNEGISAHKVQRVYRAPAFLCQRFPRGRDRAWVFVHTKQDMLG